jgi:hypothetical protein
MRLMLSVRHGWNCSRVSKAALISVQTGFDFRTGIFAFF